MTKTGTSRPIISCQMTDFDVIDHLHALCGGNVHVPAERNPKHKPVKTWRLSGRPAADLMIELLPILGKRRSSKVREVLDTYDKYLKSQENWVTNCKAAAEFFLTQGGTYRSVGRQFGIAHPTVKKYVELTRGDKGFDRC